MRSPKLLSILVLCTLGAANSFAAKTVQSKQGDLDLVSAPNSKQIVCTVAFSEQIELLKQQELWSLLSAKACNGWAENKRLVATVKAADVEYDFENQIVQQWMSNQNLEMILEMEKLKDDGIITIDRNFKEYLQYTMDRESTERMHSEN
jgi:hypothetical protein